jgi:hypothetical protein
MASLLAVAFADHLNSAGHDEPIVPPYASGPGRMRRITATSLSALAPFPAVNIMGLAV